MWTENGSNVPPCLWALTDTRSSAVAVLIEDTIDGECKLVFLVRFNPDTLARGVLMDGCVIMVVSCAADWLRLDLHREIDGESGVTE